MNKILVLVSLWVFFATSMFSSQSAFAGLPIPDLCDGVDCSTGNPCTESVCVLGTCSVAIPSNDGGACDDGIQCTINETCSVGLCIGEVAPDGTACNDGNSCTSETCSTGICSLVAFGQGGTCETSNQCTSGTCQIIGDGCITVEVGNTPPFLEHNIDCNDFIFCEASPRAAGTFCSDGNTCTSDACNGSGNCDSIFFSADTPCDDGTQCTINDVCNGSGNCAGIDASVGTPCGDSSDTECTNPDTCNNSGVCQSNNELPFTTCGDPAAECFLESFCDGIFGICVGDIPRLFGDCDDGNECTFIDACDFQGNCLGISSPSGTSCGDSSDGECINPDKCDGIGNCQSNDEPDNTSCDDGELCTIDEFCKDGECGMGTETPILACMDDESEPGSEIGGALLQINTTPLLLAGAQMTASWVIPVIAAGAGIGLVFVRKSEKS